MSRRFQAVSLIAFGFVALCSTNSAQAQPAAQTRPVILKVLVPFPTAQLTIEGLPTKQPGTSRSFISPPLEPNRSYSYTLVATWQPNNYETVTRTREYIVKAGQEVDADMRQPDEKHPDKRVPRWVATPPEVVDAMMVLGGVGKDDVVYDLGCGDGRLVIAAVTKFGAKHGVGVDPDAKKVEESKANAKKQGAENKVEFRQGDVLDIKDLSAASVVMLYMSDDLNLSLRPTLQKTLKPGSRIVSHRFAMGDWKPTMTEKIVGKDGQIYVIHLWKIPAEGAGK